MKNLPEELILEILLRLPVKSLLRFRSVSKSWLALISNPQFAKSHFERYSMHTERLIYIAANEARSIDFEAPFANDSFVVRLNFPFPAPSDRIRIMGSCRGFLLLLLLDELLDDTENLFVWNPSTGVCRALSYSPMSYKRYYFLYGFGYDSSTDDYLVVLASYYVHLGNSVTGFEFFSLRNNSWKEIERTNFLVLSGEGSGILLNGAVHWTVYRPDKSAVVILAFDLIGKNFRELPMPAGIENDMAFNDFRVLGGCLSLSIVNEGTTEIWMMKEYEVKSSWAKSITISAEEIVTHYFSPISFTRDGDIVGIDGNPGLIKCSREGELLEQCACCHNEHRCQVAVYSENLLPLPSYSEEEGKNKQQ